jgi:hypothetical protein
MNTTDDASWNVHILLVLVSLVVAVFSMPAALAAALFGDRQASSSTVERTLTFSERVAYQRIIEDVYWRHRIWPNERPDPKPSLDTVMSQAQLEQKVEDYLRNSKALENYWQRPLTADQLQAEMERMAKNTKRPEMLRELFEALGDDPFVIAECLARPVLAERLVANWYAYDERFHGALKRRAEGELRTYQIPGQMQQTSGIYREIEFAKRDNIRQENKRGHEHCVLLDSREWDQNVEKLATMFDNGTISARNAASSRLTQIKTGLLSPLQEDASRYYGMVVVEYTNDRLKVATVSWLKEPVEAWRQRPEHQLANAIVAPKGNYTLPEVANGEGECADDTWTATSVPILPDVRYLYTAVWTGSEMIVWGGENGNYIPLNTGRRYNPSTDSWTATNTTNAPEARAYHAAVWTGSEMMVWGGTGDSDYLNTGARIQS